MTESVSELQPPKGARRPGLSFGASWLWAALFSVVFASALVAQERESEESSEEVTEEVALVASDAWIVASAHLSDGRVIAPAVLLVHEGRFVAVGTPDEVEVPADAERHEHPELHAYPGFVHAALPGLEARPSFSTNGSAKRGERAVLASEASLDRRLLAALHRAGFTTMHLMPKGGGSVGQGAILRGAPLPTGRGAPSGVPASKRLVDERAGPVFGFSASTSGKKLLEEQLKGARAYLKALEAYEKAKASAGSKKEEPKKEEPKKEEKKEGKEEEKGDKKEDAKKKDEEKKKDEPKAPKEPKLDKKLAPLVAHLRGETPAYLVLDSASDWLHVAFAFELEKAFRPHIVWSSGRGAGGNDGWRVMDQLVESGFGLVSEARLGRKPRTITRRHGLRTLVEGGIPLALIPFGQLRTPDDFRHQLSEMVRHGMDERAVLRAVTRTPAEMIGMAHRVGDLATGLDADLILFDGPMLAPATRLVTVIARGEKVIAGQEDDS